jgi:hypothetical protein
LDLTKTSLPIGGTALSSSEVRAAIRECVEVKGSWDIIFKNGKEYEFRGVACEWQALDAIYSISEIQFKLWNWKSARRFAVVREKIQSKRSAGANVKYPDQTRCNYLQNSLDSTALWCW